MLQKNRTIFGNYAKLFSLKNFFHYQQKKLKTLFIMNRNLLLKLKEMKHKVKQQLQVFSIIIS